MRASDLNKAYTPVPDGFHDALFAAAHRVKEEKQLKHTFRAAAIALIVTALLCGTALALTSLYSVRDTWDGSPHSEEFLNHVLDIHQTFENERIKLTITDAVFDGQEFEVAIDLQSPDPQKPVYIYPRLEAVCDGQPIGVDIEGMAGDFLSGFLYPNAVTGDLLEGCYGFSGVIFDDKNATGDVTFTLTLKLLMPNWPVLDAGTNQEMEQFIDAYKNRQIYTTWGDSLVEYSWGAAKAMGMSEEEQNTTRTGDLLEKSDAFTLMDTVQCTFTMPVPKSFASIATVGGEIPFGEGLTLRVEELSVSFMRLQYVFLVIPESDSTWEEAFENSYRAATGKNADPKLQVLIQSATVDFTVTDEKGNVLTDTSGHQIVELEGGGWAVAHSGLLAIKEDMPKQLTFTPSNGQTALTFGLDK